MDSSPPAAASGHALYADLCRHLESSPLSDLDRSRLFAGIVADCADAALRHREVADDLLSDARPRLAVAVARRWSRGEATEAELDQAVAVASAACRDLSRSLETSAFDSPTWRACLAAVRAVQVASTRNGCPAGDFMLLPSDLTAADVAAARAYQARVVRRHAARFGLSP